MRPASGRGRGKVILLGEHAVVYGHPALAGALDRGVTCRVEPRRGAPLGIAIPAWDARAVAEPGGGGLAGALAAVAAALGAGDAGADISAEAEIPAGAGLGSSAALSVAVARALAGATGQTALDTAAVERAADAGERIVHGRASGVDVAVAARGGLGVFTRGRGLSPVETAPIPLAVALSGQVRPTAEMVALVAAARRADPGATRRLDRLGDAALRGADAARRGDVGELGGLLCAAHETLAELGVSTPALDALVADALAAGARGAKLTGAGGGGAVIALAPGREREVLARWRDRGVEAFVGAVGGDS